MPSLRRFDPHVFLESIGTGKTITTYRPRQVVFRQGTEANNVYYLQGGRAKETVESERGSRNVMIGVIEPGMFFGINPLLGGANVVRLSTVTAVTTCTVTAIALPEMKRVLQELNFVQLFMADVLRHYAKSEADKVDLLFNNSEKRLMRCLLMLAHISDGPAQLIGPEITQEMLANMIGSGRPRVNHFLNKFRKMGFIRYNGGIVVLPALLNAVLLGDD